MISTVNDYGCGVIALLNVSGHIVLLSRDLWRRCNRFLKKEKSSPASPKKSYALNTRLHPPLQAVSLPFFSDSFPVSRYTRSLSFAWWLWISSRMQHELCFLYCARFAIKLLPFPGGEEALSCTIQCRFWQMDLPDGWICGAGWL